jgi:hypothetical protein
MNRFLNSRVFSRVTVVAGLLSVASAQNTEESLAQIRTKFDRRVEVLRRFFHDNHCPDEDYAAQFVLEADNHNLDWRLLPSLALVESGGGRRSAGNNHFGWDNGQTRFASISQAIHTVADAISTGKYYKGKSLVRKLGTYNTHVDYAAMVLSVMNQIAPSPRVEFAE